MLSHLQVEKKISQIERSHEKVKNIEDLSISVLNNVYKIYTKETFFKGLSLRNDMSIPFEIDDSFNFLFIKKIKYKRKFILSFWANGMSIRPSWGGGHSRFNIVFAKTPSGDLAINSHFIDPDNYFGLNGYSFEFVISTLKQLNSQLEDMVSSAAKKD